jgi:hypothetical protein
MSDQEYGKNVQNTFERRKLNHAERLLVKVTNLTKLAEIQQTKMIGMYDFIGILKEKIKERDKKLEKDGSHFQMRRQRDEWERKYYAKCEELDRWKAIKFQDND